MYTKNPHKALVHAGRLEFTNIRKFRNEKGVSVQTTPKVGIDQNVLISSKSFYNYGLLEAGNLLEFGDDALSNGKYFFKPLSQTKSEQTNINAHIVEFQKDSVFKSMSLTGKSDNLTNKTTLSFINSDVKIGNFHNEEKLIVEEDFNIKAFFIKNIADARIKAKNIYINKYDEPNTADIFRNDGLIEIAENCEAKWFKYVTNNGKISVDKSLIFDAQTEIKNVGEIYSLGTTLFKAKLIHNMDLLDFQGNFTLNAANFQNNGIIQSVNEDSLGTILGNVFQLDGRILVPKLRFAEASSDIDADIRMNGLVDGKELVIATDCFELNKSGFLHVADVIFEKAPHTMNFHGKVDLKSLKFPENQKVDFNLSKTANIHVTGPFTINSIGNVLDGDLSAESITLNTDVDIIKTGTFVAENYIFFNANNITENGMSTAKSGCLTYKASEKIIKTNSTFAKLNIHFEAADIREDGSTKSEDANITYVAQNDIIKNGSLIASKDLNMRATNIHDVGVSSAEHGRLSYNAIEELKIPEADKIITHNIHLAMGKDFVLNVPLHQMKDVSVNAGHNFIFQRPLQAEKLMMHSQGENIIICLVPKSYGISYKNLKETNLWEVYCMVTPRQRLESEKKYKNLWRAPQS